MIFTRSQLIQAGGSISKTNTCPATAGIYHFSAACFAFNSKMPSIHSQKSFYYILR